MSTPGSDGIEDKTALEPFQCEGPRAAVFGRTHDNVRPALLQNG